MTTSLNLPNVVSTPGELIAALPHLLGFHPSESLVLVVLVGNSIEQTLRVDLPCPRDDRRAADQVALPLWQSPSRRRVAVLVIGGGRGDPPETLPREHLVAHVEASLASVGIPVTCAAWSPATAKGAPWLSYHGLGEEGEVPDPSATPLAAQTVAQGLITYPDRQALADTLTPDPEEALAGRSATLDRLAAEAEAEAHDCADPAIARHHHALVRAEVVRARDRKRALTDDEVAALAFALSDLLVRDASLAYAVGEHALSAEQLWAELTRASPVPERAEPATLLAFSAYIRGDGAYASMALDRAQEAQPAHRLAGLLRMALDNGMPPTTVRELAERAARVDWFPPESAAERIDAEETAADRSDVEESAVRKSGARKSAAEERGAVP